MHDFTDVTYEVDEGLAWITINRPDAGNAMTQAMRDQLADWRAGRNAVYQLVKTEAKPEAIRDRWVTCRYCRGPLPAREGKFVLKYLLLRNAGSRRISLPRQKQTRT